MLNHLQTRFIQLSKSYTLELCHGSLKVVFI